MRSVQRMAVLIENGLLQAEQRLARLHRQRLGLCGRGMAQGNVVTRLFGLHALLRQQRREGTTVNVLLSRISFRSLNLSV